VSTVVAGHLHDPAALDEVLVTLLEESPDVGSLSEAPPDLLPATWARSYRLGVHPILHHTPLRGAKGHYGTSSARHLRESDEGAPQVGQGPRWVLAVALHR